MGHVPDNKLIGLDWIIPTNYLSSSLLGCSLAKISTGTI